MKNRIFLKQRQTLLNLQILSETFSAFSSPNLSEIEQKMSKLQFICQNNFFLMRKIVWKTTVGFSTGSETEPQTSYFLSELFSGVIKNGFHLSIQTFWGKTVFLWKKSARFADIGQSFSGFWSQTYRRDVTLAF